MEITSVDGFLKYYERIRKRTLRVNQCIPPAKIGWRYAGGKFSLGDLIRHIAAMERWNWAEVIQGRPSCYRGCGPELAEGYEAVLAYMDRLHRESVEIFSGLSDADLRAKIETPMGVPITTWKWLRALVEHEIHHRGQIYTYLGMLGVETPPLYGATAEEVAARTTT